MGLNYFAWQKNEPDGKPSHVWLVTERSVGGFPQLSFSVTVEIHKIVTIFYPFKQKNWDKNIQKLALRLRALYGSAVNLTNS